MKIKKFLVANLCAITVIMSGCNNQQIVKEEVATVSPEVKNTEEVKQQDGEITNKTAEEDKEQQIILNQIGYLPNEVKKIVFRSGNIGDTFDVVNVTDNKIVYTGTIESELQSKAAEEKNYIGDFTEFTQEGSYKIVSETLGESYEFKIGNDIYKDVFRDAVRFFYLQRCGEEIPEAYGTKWAHTACHTGLATIYGTDKKIDVSGGWHDAGDYGRYVVATSKVVADLLLSYEANKEAFGDDLDIPESGNGIPDVLDEVKYQLIWLLKMQDPESGGVYHKVTCANFPGFVMPQEEISELIVCPISTTATGDFAAVMAMGYETYKEMDPELANDCLNAAKKAWKYLEETPSQLFSNPDGVVTGEYLDWSDTDEKFWAAVQLFRATGEESYQAEIEEILQGVIEGNKIDFSYGWQGVAAYGLDAYLACPNANQEICEGIKEAFIKQMEPLLEASNNDAYNIAASGRDVYYWGSNLLILSRALLLNQAGLLSQDDKFIDCAKEQVNYCFGKNSMAMSYVTGYGTAYPKHPHHRPSVATNQTIPGMIIGGPNAGLEDDVAKSELYKAAPAKSYIDDFLSYSTNEVDIYWNSALVYALAKLKLV